MIERRLGGRSLGFGADVKSRKQRNISELLKHVEPGDLLRFGMIPEFIGRLPIITALEELDQEALISILTQPKNALTKQYRKLLELDGVSLKFTDGALKAIATEAIRRKAGARGLRSILESSMLEVMYDLPSRKTAREVVISEDVILKKSEPVVLHANEKDETPAQESA